MEKKFVVVLLVFSAGSLSMAAPFENQEAEGEECTVNQYYEDGVCKNCAPCVKYNRHPSTEPRACGRTIEDCGPCLPGFQAKEWTQGRYSPMCSKVTGSEESPPVRTTSDGVPTSLEPVFNFNFDRLSLGLGIVGAAIILVAGVTSGVIYYRKRLSRHPRRCDEETAKMLEGKDPPPYQPQAPPYEAFSGAGLVSAECARDQLIICSQSNEAVTNAAPFEHFIEDEDHFPHLPDIGVNADRLSTSSEDTEPDHWEPSEDHMPHNIQPDPGIETEPNSPRSQPWLHRAQSLDLHPDPNLGNYEGVHIRLSELRQSVDGTPSASLPGSLRDISPRLSDTRCTTPGLPTYADEGEEPDPPHSFSFNNLSDAQSGGQNSHLIPVANTSHDSGFEEDPNRRRNHSDAFELSVFVRLDVKRRRNE